MSEVIILRDGLHSELGPSAAEKWLACPGSVLASRGVPGKQTKYAAEGVAAHTLSEWSRNEGKPTSAWKGVTLKVDDFSFKIGKSMVEGVQKFVDDVSAIPGAPIVEEMVGYEELVPGGFGTLDDGRLEDGLCTVTDLKFGQGVKVFAKDNPQMKLYSLGLFFKYKWIYDFDKFVMKICQPRLRHFEEDEISLGHLLQWGYDVVRPGAKLALTPGAPIVAGKHCKFCRLKDTCKVRAEYKFIARSREVNAESEFEDLT
jgi:hypothetical protein